MPLPKQAYQYTDIKTVKVNVDYHIQHQSHTNEREIKDTPVLIL